MLLVFIAHNDIHGSLEEGYSPGRVRTRLRAQIHFSHTSYSLQIPALTRTLKLTLDGCCLISHVDVPLAVESLLLTDVDLPD